MELIRSTSDDAERIWQMQKRSFLALFEKYRDTETNPANESKEKVLKRLEQDSTYYYLIRVGEVEVGAIRIVDFRDERPKRISPVFILPEYRRKGYARQAIIEAENIHGADNWELETILQEEGNCRFYESIGYRKTGKMQIINDKMTLVYYRK